MAENTLLTALKKKGARLYFPNEFNAEQCMYIL